MKGIMQGMQIAVAEQLFRLVHDAEMAEDFGHDLAAGAGRHRLFDEVAGVVDEQAIAPQHADIFRLADEMRLVRDDDRRAASSNARR